jgi:hypothetical protein
MHGSMYGIPSRILSYNSMLNSYRLTNGKVVVFKRANWYQPCDISTLLIPNADYTPSLRLYMALKDSISEGTL